MGFQIDTKDFIAYFEQTKKVIAGQREYVTELDSTTGDGDHWVNINMGFEKITALSQELETMDLAAMFKKVGMTMYSAVGGSSGALYGSGYMAASRYCTGKDYLDVHSLYEMYEAMLQEIMKRGKTEPGQKTMLDALSQALLAYKAALDAQADEKEVIKSFIEGARQGAESTRDMEAVKGRASYRTDKGVGHLDPGAVTMAMQLESMGTIILEKLK
ncbi:dihydroxyacetone kinase subunit L [Erysipelotrichaceae bacterium AF15-26LB]|nr:dihydroxyacetone kinase, L subunit [Erysipelotrichaceae bacterium 3_1_53]MCR0328570.1 dihydroxyacetone kinase subunit L [[Clostridium] innocuum]MCR0350280.1 dihydroxyacetone kinase subunit L [[Clostridium] innocuum]RJV83109.1 dihydroxyacetone kinase subunit L [Erysipelotrichaceae bacterium AF19-24AC]RJV83313.1 dihydroxyacetone kinase subunit L [Erysipelotrichaceae bacterium AF15-26LB]